MPPTCHKKWLRRTLCTGLLLLLLAVAASAERVRGTRRKDETLYRGKQFTCKDGSQTIDAKLVNDNYCDCADGSDEPGTSACSNGRFWCVNKGYKGQFVQSSRVNDGICDCCDGSDEQETQCQNTCAALAEEAQKDTKEAIARIELGIEKKKQWIAEAAAALAEKQKELQEKATELATHEAEVEKLQAIKDAEEAKEKEENDRREAEKKAKEEAEKANQPAEEASGDATPDQPAAGDAPTSEEQASTEEDAAAAAKKKEEEEAAAFPYPKEYAAPPTGGDADDKEKKDKDSDEAAFPYPKEYAAPPADDKPAEEATTPEEPAAAAAEEQAEEKEEEKPDEPYKSEGAGALDDQPGAPEQGSSQSTAPTPNKDTASPTRNADGTGQLDTEPVAKDGKSFLGYLWRWVNRPLEWFMRPFPTTFLAPTFAPSPTPASVPTTAAEKARNEYDEAVRKRDDVKNQHNDVKSYVDADLGPDRVFAALYKKCFSFKEKQYTYEMCPYGSATQKEHSGTSLGNFEKFDAEKQSFTFTNGQKCWNGPHRSLEVLMECGADNEIISVEEPSKCVYEMKFRTPAVCNDEHLTALRFNLEAGFGDEEE